MPSPVVNARDCPRKPPRPPLRAVAAGNQGVREAGGLLDRVTNDVSHGFLPGRRATGHHTNALPGYFPRRKRGSFALPRESV